MGGRRKPDVRGVKGTETAAAVGGEMPGPNPGTDLEEVKLE